MITRQKLEQLRARCNGKELLSGQGNTSVCLIWERICYSLNEGPSAAEQENMSSSSVVQKSHACDNRDVTAYLIENLFAIYPSISLSVVPQVQAFAK